MRGYRYDKRQKYSGFYERYIKRIFDIGCSLAALICFGWLYIVIGVLVKIKIGSPIFFFQERPGRNEKIFKLCKFRTMTNERDKNGELLPDERRLTEFGRWLRKTSLDELPEVFNILKGDMSVVGPRPQLVRDMVFMTEKQRRRHLVRPGLSGLAQVNGRNSIGWEERLAWDLRYIQRITFVGDIKIILQTIVKAFVKQEGITEENMATSMDYGDWLLRQGKVTEKEYREKQAEGNRLIAGVR